MRDIYILRLKSQFGGEILAAADDHDRMDMEMAKFTAIAQSRMEIINTDLLEDGD